MYRKQICQFKFFILYILIMMNSGCSKIKNLNSNEIREVQVNVVDLKNDKISKSFNLNSEELKIFKNWKKSKRIAGFLTFESFFKITYNDNSVRYYMAGYRMNGDMFLAKMKNPTDLRLRLTKSSYYSIIVFKEFDGIINESIRFIGP